jgi:acyl-CoA thioester hydrolase
MRFNFSMTNFKHKFPIQIRFKDVDKMGHVNNANHLTYIELARLKYFEEIVKMEGGWSKEVGLILARIEIDYKQPIFLNDQIFVYTRCSKIGSKSLELDWQVVREKNGVEEIVAKGIAVIVYFDYQHGKTMPVPNRHRELFEKYEGRTFL